MTLRERAAAVLDDASGALATGSPADLRAAVASHRRRIDEPMRVAVVGRIKAGKSTMINALLDADLAPTGDQELTFNVTVFVRGARDELVVHRRDTRPSETHPLADLASMVDRTRGDAAELRSIASLEVHLDRPILDRLELVDTPGFGSFFEADSQNTLDFLGIDAAQVDATTRRHAAGADAVVYLFARGLAASDRDLVVDFEGAGIGEFTPVNAIAVLTKIDAYWEARTPDVDPMVAARRVTARLKTAPGVDRVFFDVLPVCGLMASGSGTLDAGDLDALGSLARLPPATLAKRLGNASRFTGAETDTGVSQVRRASLHRRLGRYGIWSAAGLVRDGAGAAELRDLLWAASGVDRVRDVLLTHYAERATVIKTGSAVNRSRELCSRAGRLGDRSAAYAAGLLERFELEEHSVSELGLLRRLYRDEARLGLQPAEVEELVTVCGERGSSCHARLGATTDATIPELRALATTRIRYWRARADGFGISRTTADAMQQLCRSYEVVSYHLTRAQEHLEMST